jgi:2-dehydro-3-deoxyphosphogluconate aldolase / (4S)-4-hydroxy-2-oxoglutarate aldolase
MAISKLMRIAPVIPVLVVEYPDHARPLAEIFVEEGLPVIEVTLRTSTAIKVIREMAKVDGAIVGAGTVLSADDVQRSQDAGAHFLVSPGLTDALGKAAIASALPFLPGVANASDIIRGLEMGIDHFKFFPAASNGGISALKGLSAPFRTARFCPTGGITEATAPKWLALKSVLCVGGSWLFPADIQDVGQVRTRVRRLQHLFDSYYNSSTAKLADKERGD